ncbi:MAG: deoxyribonuclease IV [Candidatus Methanomethylicaceae archaeon]
MYYLRVGVHISIAGSLDRSVERAVKIGCNTFQLFTRNPRGWSFSDIPSHVVASFKDRLNNTDIKPVVGHMPYLPNLATPNEEVYRKSVDTLKAELERCSILGIPYLVTHLGSHLGSGKEMGRDRLVFALNSALETNKNCMLLLENTAGQKNSMGTKFEEIREIMDRIDYKEKVGFCFDTCHAFVAGYDIKTRIGEVMDELDCIIGIGRLKIIHLNDSKGDLGSHLDRHEHIGLGKIGEEGFMRILSDKRVTSVPLIMETPVDSRRDDRGNIVKVYELAKSLAP